MSAVALVLSGVAVLVAAGSAIYARQVAHIQAGRRLAERKPAWTGVIDRHAAHGWHELRLRLDAGEQLAGLDVEILETEAVTFSAGRPGGISAGGARVRAASFGRLDIGDCANWYVFLLEDRPAQVLLRVVSRGSGKRDRWTQMLAIDVPPTPPRTSWIE